MMNKSRYLTNERLKGLFSNNFDLTNYAIKIARARVLKEEQPIQLEPFIEGLRKDLIEEKEQKEQKEGIDN